MQHKPTNIAFFLKTRVPQHLPLILLLLISLVALIPLVKPGFFLGLDGELHLGRTAAYAQALQQGHFPVRWAANLNYAYGYPIFNFIYPFPYLVSASFYLLGFSLALSIKFTLGLSLLLSVICMYQAINLWTANKWAAYTAGVVYLLAPYRFLDTYLRVALGEAVAFIFPPLIFYGFLLWVKQKHPIGWPLMVISSTLLILSHNVLAILFLGFIALLCLHELVTTHPHQQILKQKSLYLLLFGFILAGVISAFFWLPGLFELKYTLAKFYLFEKDFHDHFLSLSDLIFKPLGDDQRYNLVYIGFESLGIIVLYTWQLIRKKQSSSRNLFLLASLIISLFLVTSWSVKIWENLPLMPYFQIPSRFLTLATLIIALMSGILITITSKKILTVTLITLLFTTMTITHYQVHKPTPINESYFENYPKSTTWHNEASPIWTAGETDHYPTSPFQIQGSGQIINSTKSHTQHLIKIETAEPITFIDNTIYFPGWKAYIDGQETPIQFQDPAYRGLITITVPPGKHQVEIVFTKTKIRLFSEVVSLIGILILSLTFLLTYRNNHPTHLPLHAK